MNFRNIFSLFEFAVGSGLKYPKIRLQATGLNGRVSPVVISRNGSKSRNPGHLSVTNGERYGSFNNIYFGRIDPDGQFFQASNGQGNQFSVIDLLTRLAADPVAVAVEYGKLTGNCSFCETQLTDPQSVALGYGPVCAKHWHLPHSYSGPKADKAVNVAQANPVIDAEIVEEDVPVSAAVPAASQIRQAVPMPENLPANVKANLEKFYGVNLTSDTDLTPDNVKWAGSKPTISDLGILNYEILKNMVDEGFSVSYDGKQVIPGTSIAEVAVGATTRSL